jgi:hypothetical protein
MKPHRLESLKAAAEKLRLDYGKEVITSNN